MLVVTLALDCLASPHGEEWMWSVAWKLQTLFWMPLLGYNIDTIFIGRGDFGRYLTLKRRKGTLLFR